MNRPLGVFDSGVGGLTVVTALREVLPAEDIIYFGDTARVPYGSKSASTVRRFAMEACLFLIGHGVKLIAVACNTASALSLKMLESSLAVPVIGVIEPGAREALRRTRRKRIAVIGTESTVRSGAYREILRGLDPGVEVVEKACPLFVPLAEEGWTEGDVALAAAGRYLSPLRKAGPDVLVLGCTHYPLLRGAIETTMGPGVEVVDSASSCAAEVGRVLRERNLRRAGTRGGELYFVSDSPERFRRVGERFTGRPLRNVRGVDIAAGFPF